MTHKDISSIENQLEIQMALMPANPKAPIQLTLTDGPGGHVTSRFDVFTVTLAPSLRRLLPIIWRLINRTITVDIREATT